MVYMDMFKSELFTHPDSICQTWNTHVTAHDREDVQATWPVSHHFEHQADCFIVCQPGIERLVFFSRFQTKEKKTHLHSVLTLRRPIHGHTHTQCRWFSMLLTCLKKTKKPQFPTYDIKQFHKLIVSFREGLFHEVSVPATTRLINSFNETTYFHLVVYCMYMK